MFFLWGASAILGLLGWASPLPFSGALAETSVLIAVSYICGALLQALGERLTEKCVLLKLWGGFPSARWLLPSDNRLSPEYKYRLFELVNCRFGWTVDETLTDRQRRLRSNQEVFYLCYMAVDKLNDRPQIFNAQYGFFRCLLTLFSLLGLLSVVVAMTQWQALPEKRWLLVALPLSAAVAAWLSYERCKKRGEDFAKSVFDLFLASGGAQPDTRS